MELALHSVDPTKNLDMCTIWDGLLPSDEVFLDSLIHSDLLLDVGSIVTNSNPNFFIRLIFPLIGLLVLILLSLWTLPLSSKSMILMSFIFLMNFSTPMILSFFLQTIYPLLIFSLLLRLILLIINP